MAKLEIDALSSRQLDDYLRSIVSGCQEFREILLLFGHFSVCRVDRSASSCGHSGRRDGRNLLFYHPEMVQTVGPDRLVCRCDPMFLLAFRLLRQHHHVFLAQRIQAQHLQVRNKIARKIVYYFHKKNHRTSYKFNNN